MILFWMFSTAVMGIGRSAHSNYQFRRIQRSCGSFPLTKTVSLGFSSKWTSTNLTYVLSDIQYANLRLSSAAVRFSVAAAFDSWAAVTPLRFVETQDSREANIKISFATGDHGDGVPFDGPGGRLAHSFTPPLGILHFDAAEYWNVDGLDNPPYFPWIDLQSVALHEIGHILGLGHAPNPEAVMYKFISVREVKRDLTPHDVQCAAALYAAAPELPVVARLLFALICTLFLSGILFAIV